VVIDNLSGAGNVTLSLNGSGTGIVDAVDNAVTGGLTGETYAIDRVARQRPASTCQPTAATSPGKTSISR
jgi:hypothetical protein